MRDAGTSGLRRMRHHPCDGSVHNGDLPGHGVYRFPWSHASQKVLMPCKADTVFCFVWAHVESPHGC